MWKIRKFPNSAETQLSAKHVKRSVCESSFRYLGSKSVCRVGLLVSRHLPRLQQHLIVADVRPVDAIRWV